MDAPACKWPGFPDWNIMSEHKFYIDDVRKIPDNSWTLIKNSRAALISIDGMRRMGKKIKAISFDHDLGNDDTTRPVMLYLCEFEFWPEKVYVHSQNNVGNLWLQQMTERYAPPGTFTRY